MPPPPPPPGWGPPPPAPPYGGPQAFSGSSTNQLCLTSMILGISGAAMSFCCALFGVPLGIAAVITGIIGLVQLKEGAAQAGRGQAIAGICCGVASLVLPFLFMALSVGGTAFTSF